MYLPTLRDKNQERFVRHTSLKGVGQFHNPAQRERCSYLYNNNTIISVPQHSLLTNYMFFGRIQHITKIMIPNTNQKTQTTERLNIYNRLYLQGVPFRRILVGLIVFYSFPMGPFFLLQTVTIKHLINS